MKIKTKRRIKKIGFSLLILLLILVIGLLAAEIIGRKAMTGKRDESLQHCKKWSVHYNKLYQRIVAV